MQKDGFARSGTVPTCPALACSGKRRRRADSRKVEDISLCPGRHDGNVADSTQTLRGLSTNKTSEEQDVIGNPVLKTIHEPALRIPLTPNQIRGFWAAWGGLVLDGMDSFIYALVLVPAMRDLLPRSGIEPTIGNLGFYGSILFSVFLVGWGCAFLWGPIADRFGRVRALIFAILCYSVFTFLGCMAQNIWQLGLFRFLAGFGVGGEFVGAAVFVAEELPGEPSGIRSGLSECRLLRRHLSRCGTQLSDWRAPGMAGHVRRWDRTRPVCRLHPLSRA